MHKNKTNEYIKKLKAMISVIRENTEHDGYCYLTPTQIVDETVLTKGVLVYYSTLRILLLIGAVVKDVKTTRVPSSTGVKEINTTVYRVAVDDKEVRKLFIKNYVQNNRRTEEKNVDIRLYKFEDTVFI